MAIVFRFVSCNTQCVPADMHDTRCYRQESLPSVNDALRWLLNRRRSFAELVAAVWRVCGIDGSAVIQEPAAETLRLRTANLSRASALGPVDRKHLFPILIAA